MLDLNFNLTNIDISLNPLVWLNRLRFKKENIRILFIDDTDMPVIANLKKAGWSVEKVKDVRNIDDEIVKRNHIIFVDYKGVGRNISPKHEGVGLAIQIKKSYGKRKRVIIYSANSTFSSDTVLDANISCIDNWILKNEDTTVFIDRITSEMHKLR